jgi:uncharacterized CHY-type Zn-finger protein
MRTNNHTMKNLIPDNSTSSIHFVLCESCFWSATILKMREDSVCPACADSNVSFIPLSINESSRLSMSAKSWLEASFSSAKRNAVRQPGVGFDNDLVNKNNNIISTIPGAWISFETITSSVLRYQRRYKLTADLTSITTYNRAHCENRFKYTKPLLGASKRRMFKRMPRWGKESSMWKIDIARLLTQNKQLVVVAIEFGCSAIIYSCYLGEITLAYQRSAAEKTTTSMMISRERRAIE